MQTPLRRIGDAEPDVFMRSLKEARHQATRAMAGTKIHSDAYILLCRLTAAMDRVAELYSDDIDLLKAPQVTLSDTQRTR